MHKSQQTVKGCNFANHVLSVATIHLCPCSTRAAIGDMQENECNCVPVKHIYKIRWQSHLTHRVRFASVVLVGLALSLLVSLPNFMVFTPPNSFTNISHGIISSSIISIRVALIYYASLSIRYQPVITWINVVMRNKLCNAHEPYLSIIIRLLSSSFFTIILQVPNFFSPSIHLLIHSYLRINAISSLSSQLPNPPIPQTRQAV